MRAFDAAIEELLPKEGGYTNDPADSGGETNFGITAKAARAFGYLGPMQDMSRDQAKAIYMERYWSPNLLSSVDALSPLIARELFDTGVNLGPAMAAEFLQRSLNVLNQGGAMFKDIAVDGRVGSMTFAALREYLGRRGKDGERVLYRALNALQGAFYIELAERREKDERFVFGWFVNRVGM